MSWKRRQVLAGALAGGGMIALAACSSLPNPPADEPALARETVTLPETDGRARQLTLWAPPDPRGVVLFSAGWAARPERYVPLIERLGGMGIAIVAPLHMDAGGAPATPNENAVEERLADLAAAAGFAQQHFARLPALAMGHGLGSQTAMALGGALAEAGTFSEPTPRGVIALSLPNTSGPAGPDAFAGLDVPLLLITAGGAGRPSAGASADQLFPAEQSSADSYALVLAGAGQDFIDDAVFVERAWPVIDLFVQAYLFDIFTAGDVLESWPATGADRFVARRGGE